eukprot:1156280-Pelagomonas_calceolata.AAC.2
MFSKHPPSTQQAGKQEWPQPHHVLAQAAHGWTTNGTQVPHKWHKGGTQVAHRWQMYGAQMAHRRRTGSAQVGRLRHRCTEQPQATASSCSPSAARKWLHVGKHKTPAPGAELELLCEGGDDLAAGSACSFTTHCRLLAGWPLQGQGSN